MAHHEGHRVESVGWLRAGVLGANDGIVSIAALLLGVAAADASAVFVAGAAGLVGGALSMAVGEYVSVSSQADAENADIAKETWEIEHEPDAELRELTGIWRKRGLSKELAAEVAEALHAHDALGAHLRDELGITELSRARPLRAGIVSALSFLVGGALPVLAAIAVGEAARPVAIGVASVAALALLGIGSARLGGAPVARGTLRVTAGGAGAMALAYVIGAWVGVAV